MSLKNDAFPSSAAFDLINDTLAAAPKEREEAIKAAKGVFAFTLTNEAGATESWYLDFKDKGVVGKGAAPEGGKADVTLVLSDKDFAALVAGTANAQRLFMGGKLKIRGNAMKAMKIEPILSKAKTKAKL
ncbi:fatty acid-binding protein [Arthroderma uncinatum]|uniref:fatty acid-binding protein n=1 Tax=Arthroderma uncinatum TaxID=74035 RepID=UPI00144A924B|nr:fatty acid-binding protein [Arthroderma uncinatum]KAF3490602.1 fatty acid-binding protein [Arthroderma uncinatum]